MTRLPNQLLPLATHGPKNDRNETNHASYGAHNTPDAEKRKPGGEKAAGRERREKKVQL